MIVVTTPTGNIGRSVVQHLLEAGEAIRVVVRDPTKLPPAVRDHVEVVEGSHGDAAVLERVLEGAEALFWLCPPTPSATPQAQTVEFTGPAVVSAPSLRFQEPMPTERVIQKLKGSTSLRAASMKASATSWKGAASTLDCDWSSSIANSR